MDHMVHFKESDAIKLCQFHSSLVTLPNGCNSMSAFIEWIGPLVQMISLDLFNGFNEFHRSITSVFVRILTKSNRTICWIWNQWIHSSGAILIHWMLAVVNGMDPVLISIANHSWWQYSYGLMTQQKWPYWIGPFALPVEKFTFPCDISLLTFLLPSAVSIIEQFVVNHFHCTAVYHSFVV